MFRDYPSILRTNSPETWVSNRPKPRNKPEDGRIQFNRGGSRRLGHLLCSVLWRVQSVCFFVLWAWTFLIWRCVTFTSLQYMQQYHWHKCSGTDRPVLSVPALQVIWQCDQPIKVTGTRKKVWSFPFPECHDANWEGRESLKTKRQCT